MLLALLFLLYFIIGLQLIIKPNRFIKLQMMISFLFTMLVFNYHSNLLSLL
jgi:hypothetical protein